MSKFLRRALVASLTTAAASAIYVRVKTGSWDMSIKP